MTTAATHLLEAPDRVIEKSALPLPCGGEPERLRLLERLGKAKPALGSLPRNLIVNANHLAATEDPSSRGIDLTTPRRKTHLLPTR